MKKVPPIIGDKSWLKQRPGPVVLIDGRAIPGVISVDPARCLALVRELDHDGNPITNANGGLLTTRRAGKIEILGAPVGDKP